MGPHKLLGRMRAVVGLWCILVVCHVVLCAYVVLQQHWLTAQAGNAGLWRWCLHTTPHSTDCSGTLSDLLTDSSLYPLLVTLSLCVMSAALVALSLLCLLLLFCCRPATVLRLTASLLLLAGGCLLSGVLVFPMSLSVPHMPLLCGASRPYVLGACSLGTGFMLAALCSVDCFVLSILAFLLASKIAKLEGQILQKWDSAMPAKSLHLQPIST